MTTDRRTLEVLVVAILEISMATIEILLVVILANIIEVLVVVILEDRMIVESRNLIGADPLELHMKILTLDDLKEDRQ